MRGGGGVRQARKDVEGSLFVVKRRSQPRFQFVVLNQRSTGAPCTAHICLSHHCHCFSWHRMVTSL